jgi:hypothetical protein
MFHIRYVHEAFITLNDFLIEFEIGNPVQTFNPVLISILTIVLNTLIMPAVLLDMLRQDRQTIIKDMSVYLYRKYYEE